MGLSSDSFCPHVSVIMVWNECRKPSQLTEKSEGRTGENGNTGMKKSQDEEGEDVESLIPIPG